jgi:modulator of FtsH protease HflC
MKRFALILFLLGLLVWVRTAFLAVDYAEFAYVTRFGEPVTVYDGASDAGLHFKAPWPVDGVVRLDRRLQSFDLPTVESLTRDQANKTVDKTLAVDAFITWRIADGEGADKFVRTLGTPEQVKRVLGPQISGRLGAIISTLPMSDLIAVADETKIDERTNRLRARLLGEGEASLKDRVREQYGLEIVDLRLRRFSYPEAVRSSIAERIRSERLRKVSEHETEGRQRAAEILTTAEREAREMESRARAEKQRLEGTADVEADRIRNEAHAQDRAFYEFLQKLKAYQILLSDTRDVLLLSTKHPLFEWLLNPPPRPATDAPKTP